MSRDIAILFIKTEIDYTLLENNKLLNNWAHNLLFYVWNYYFILEDSGYPYERHLIQESWKLKGTYLIRGTLEIGLL